LPSVKLKGLILINCHSEVHNSYAALSHLRVAVKAANPENLAEFDEVTLLVDTEATLQ
jgi:hypothetical protein